MQPTKTVINSNNRRGIPRKVAPVAMQQGTAAARNIVRQTAGSNPLPFQYRNRGTMVTIGRNLAVAHVGRRSFTGRSAWLIWLGVHLVNLIGFRNRLLVLINWAWNYWFYERAVRLILPSRSLPIGEGEHMLDPDIPEKGSTM